MAKISTFDDTILKEAASKLRNLLHKHEDLQHLDIEIRGQHLIVFSLEDGEKVRRCRLSRQPHGNFVLSFMRHTGRWEITPFEGMIEEIVNLVIRNFGWWLEDWP